MNYSYILLPGEFIYLLQANMQTSGAGYAYLKRELWNTSTFQSILARTCRDVDSQLGFEKIITSLGWLGLRDRIAASYLGFQRDGQFPHNPDLKLIEDILRAEDLLKMKTVDGYSRIFLLCFYKKMLHFRKMRNSVGEATELPPLLTKETLKVLGLVKTRTAFIDWLSVSVEGLLKFEDEERISQIISAGGGLAALKKGLNSGQREELTRQWLAYGSSINHIEAFSNPTV